MIFISQTFAVSLRNKITISIQRICPELYVRWIIFLSEFDTSQWLTVLLSQLTFRLSVNLKKGSPRLSKKPRSEKKKWDLDNVSIDRACINTGEDIPYLNAIVSSTVLDFLGKLGS